MDRSSLKLYKKGPYCGKEGPKVRFPNLTALQYLYGKTNPGHDVFSNEDNDNDTRRRSKRIGRGKRDTRLDLHCEDSIVAHSCTTRFLFFSVPAEIICMVYKYLLQDLLVRFAHVNMTVRVSMKEKERFDWKTLIQNTSPGLPKWVLLNKQFLGETVDEVHRTAYFYQMQEYRAKRAGRIRTPLYMSLNQARRVRLLDCFFDIQVKTGRDGKGYYTFGVDTFPTAT